MNDNDFNVLLDKYLDGDLTDPAERVLLRETVEKVPEHRRRFLRARQLRLAFATIPERKSGLLYFLPSVARLRHFGSMFGNTAVFAFALGLAFPNGDGVPLDITGAAHVPAAQGVRATGDSAGGTIFAQEASAEDSAYPSDGHSEMDLGSLIPAEEYGFVRL
ncbi:MAG: hypothetical protein LBG65_03910 [Puniceicoccales bacterium]|jgi:hypothetical protein|nr:hypothetical protein [Puniceicoccales bacterium]